MADLDPAIDVPVTVNIQLRDPAGRTLTTTSPSVSESSYTIAATISPFGRSDSGVYTCIATVRPSPSNRFLSDSSTQSGTFRVTTGEAIYIVLDLTLERTHSCTHTHMHACTHMSGVYLLLRGTVYTNNSVISIMEIGSTSNARLQCITDRMPCCATIPNRFGEFFFPDGTTVPTLGGATSFYRTRGDDGTVNLNRINTTIFMPTGLFCCVVPGALNVMQRVCTTISELVKFLCDYYDLFPLL
jgi:hypothetical protein